MAKFEREFKGNIDAFLAYVDESVIKGSLSASIEDSSNFMLEDVKIAVRVYERYSYIGQNRVSLNVTIIGKNDHIYLSAITSGGSQAVFFKINRFGESSFLDNFQSYIDKYIERKI
ncbi:MAG: hypothetical protein GX984_03680 [Erysipelothrix sp.]|nr:hypothetical protein [Erysipelothrix sp.]